MTLPPIWPRFPSTVISHHNLPNCPSLWNNEWTPSIRRPATSSSTPLSTSSTNTHSTAGWKSLEGRLTALSITISGSRSGTSRWHSTTTTTSRTSALKYCRIWSPGWSPTMHYQVLMFYMRSSCSSSSPPLSTTSPTSPAQSMGSAWEAGWASWCCSAPSPWTAVSRAACHLHRHLDVRLLPGRLLRPLPAQSDLHPDLFKEGGRGQDSAVFSSLWPSPSLWPSILSCSTP